jgi:hypothetical protein
VQAALNEMLEEEPWKTGQTVTLVSPLAKIAFVNTGPGLPDFFGATHRNEIYLITANFTK